MGVVASPRPVRRCLGTQLQAQDERRDERREWSVDGVGGEERGIVDAPMCDGMFNLQVGGPRLGTGLTRCSLGAH